MELLPKTLGTRPRLAVELRTEGIMAARAEDAAALLTATSRADLVAGALVPGLKPGNIFDSAGVTAALRRVLDDIAGRSAGKESGRDVTLIVPDAAVRVLLLDFDELPGKELEATPVVRFRLKKLLPFDSDDAAVSYQVMSHTKGSIQVLAVAMPRDVLAEYEGVVRNAGYLPGAVLPSTLAAVAGLDTSESPVLVVNACTATLTTAILKGGLLLLHRSVDLRGEAGRLGEDRLALDQASYLGRQPVSIDEHLGTVEETPSMPAPWPSISDADSGAMDVAQAISVAAAYFEDTLNRSPESLLVAGTLDADRLRRMLAANEFQTLIVREMVGPEMVNGGLANLTVQPGWLAGVRGALKS